MSWRLYPVQNYYTNLTYILCTYPWWQAFRLKSWTLRSPSTSAAFVHVTVNSDRIGRSECRACRALSNPSCNPFLQPRKIWAIWMTVSVAAPAWLEGDDQMPNRYVFTTYLDRAASHRYPYKQSSLLRELQYCTYTSRMIRQTVSILWKLAMQDNIW